MRNPWHSSSLGDSIFYHKGSLRTSASERILAELGTFHTPGLRGPFGLCGLPGKLFVEVRRSVLLPTSLEDAFVFSVPFDEPFLLRISLKDNNDSLFFIVSLLIFLSSTGLLLPLASLCRES